VNPIVNGEFSATHELIDPVMLHLPSGSVVVDQIDYHVRISGGWFVQQVTLDASAGLYDWIRHRVRLAPGPSQLHINNVDIAAGEPVEVPPEYVLTSDTMTGETHLSLMQIDGILPREPVPDLNPLIQPDDLDFSLKDLPPETFTSTPQEGDSKASG